MDATERFSSRKWILHKNVEIFVSVLAISLIALRLLGVPAAPDVSFTLQFWAATTGVVLGAYSTANLISKKIGESE